jgi:hypothetical protein
MEWALFPLPPPANSRPIRHCQVASWLLNSNTLLSLSSGRCRRNVPHLLYPVPARINGLCVASKSFYGKTLNELITNSLCFLSRNALKCDFYYFHFLSLAMASFKCWRNHYIIKLWEWFMMFHNKWIFKMMVVYYRKEWSNKEINKGATLTHFSTDSIINREGNYI